MTGSQMLEKYLLSSGSIGTLFIVAGVLLFSAGYNYNTAMSAYEQVEINEEIAKRALRQSEENGDKMQAWGRRLRIIACTSDSINLDERGRKMIECSELD